MSALVIRSPEDLALAFERAGVAAQKVAASAVSPRNRKEAMAEARVFAQAADLVRTCEFPNWDYKNDMTPYGYGIQ